MQVKALIRSEILTERRSLSESTIKQKSQAICRRFLSSTWSMRSKFVGVYFPLTDEVDVRYLFSSLWRRDSVLFVPVIDREKMYFSLLTRDTVMKKNHYGIFEPVKRNIISPRQLGVIVVPLVGFDQLGVRLGFGGGYYDRFFQKRPQNLVGVAFDCQYRFSLPKERHDIKLSACVTESQWYNFK